MSKKNRNRNSFVSKEDRAIEMINKNRHYTDDVRQGLINLVKRDSSLQDNVRKAYQKVTDWLRDPNRGCLEFQVERINIRSWDKDADREEWLKELCKFVDERNSAVFTEYGVKSVFVSFTILSIKDKFEHEFNIAELFADQYTGDPHCVMAVDGTQVR